MWKPEAFVALIIIVSLSCFLALIFSRIIDYIGGFSIQSSDTETISSIVKDIASSVTKMYSMEEEDIKQNELENRGDKFMQGVIKRQYNERRYTEMMFAPNCRKYQIPEIVEFYKSDILPYQIYKINIDPVENKCTLK